jgi:hypothetical protein
MDSEALWSVGGNGTTGGTSGTLTRAELERIRGGLAPPPPVNGNGHTPAPVKLCTECNGPANGARVTCGSPKCVAARRRKTKRGTAGRPQPRTATPKAVKAPTPVPALPKPTTADVGASAMPTPVPAVAEPTTAHTGASTPTSPWATSPWSTILAALDRAGAKITALTLDLGGQRWKILPTGPSSDDD